MWLTAVRDVAILVLAFESIVIGILLALMLIQIRKLVKTLREEIAPILDTANETVHTVSRTADFVSENVIAPVVKVQSYATGTREAIRSLLFISRKLRERGNHRPDDT